MPVLGVICVLIIVAGLTAGYFWPYNWADGGLEIQGFIAAVSAGAALAGYVPASLVIWGIRERREVQK